MIKHISSLRTVFQEVAPAIAVHRNGNIRVNIPNEPNGIGAVHGDLQGRIRNGDERDTEVDQCGLDVEPVLDCRELLEIDGVAREVNAIWLAVGLKQGRR